jgi:hypothetical protein
MLDDHDPTNKIGTAWGVKERLRMLLAEHEPSKIRGGWPVLHRAAAHPTLWAGPSRVVCSMTAFAVVVSTRCTSKTLNSCSRPNKTDVASDILVAPLLDVVGCQQHVGATSPSPATTRAQTHPAPVRRAIWDSFPNRFELAMRKSNIQPDLLPSVLAGCARSARLGVATKTLQEHSLSRGVVRSNSAFLVFLCCLGYQARADHGNYPDLFPGSRR